MGQYKHYQVLLTENQSEQVDYVCDELGERYEAWIEEAKEFGERPFTDRPEVAYMEIVLDTMSMIKKAIAEPVYDGESPLLRIDADQKIHLLSVLADYHSFLCDFIGDKVDNEDDIQLDLYSLYLLGNIEGRLLYGGITEGDMKILTEWDEFLEGCKEEAFEEEEGSGLIDLDKWFACPFCGKSNTGEEIQYPIAGSTIYVCPSCGCMLDEKEVERQLGMGK